MPGRHPDQRIIRADLTVPANTAETSAVSSAVTLGQVELDEVRIRIPPGHAGLTGVQVLIGGEAIAPWGQASEWFVGDDEHEIFQIGLGVAERVTIRAFNADETYQHTFYLTFVVRDRARAGDRGMLRTLEPIAL